MKVRLSERLNLFFFFAFLSPFFFNLVFACCFVFCFSLIEAWIIFFNQLNWQRLDCFSYTEGCWVERGKNGIFWAQKALFVSPASNWDRTTSLRLYNKDVCPQNLRWLFRSDERSRDSYVYQLFFVPLNYLVSNCAIWLIFYSVCIWSYRFIIIFLCSLYEEALVTLSDRRQALTD